MLVLGDANAADAAHRETLLAYYDRLDPDRVLQVGDLKYYDLPTPTWLVPPVEEDAGAIGA